MRYPCGVGHMRFGSKIRQGFAGGITSLTPPLSLSPLWISWAENEGAEGRGGVLYSCRQLVGRQGACRPAGGQQAPSKDHCAKKNIHIKVPTVHLPGDRPPAAPGGRGYRTVKPKIKNIFL